MIDIIIIIISVRRFGFPFRLRVPSYDLFVSVLSTGSILVNKYLQVVNEITESSRLLYLTGTILSICLCLPYLLIRCFFWGGVPASGWALLSAEQEDLAAFDLMKR